MKIIEVTPAEISSIPPALGCVLAYSVAFELRVNKSYDVVHDSFVTVFHLMEYKEGHFQSVMNIGEFNVKINVGLNQSLVGRNPSIAFYRMKAENISDWEAVIRMKAEIQLDTFTMSRLQNRQVLPRDFTMHVVVSPKENTVPAGAPEWNVQLPLA